MNTGIPATQHCRMFPAMVNSVLFGGCLHEQGNRVMGSPGLMKIMCMKPMVILLHVSDEHNPFPYLMFLLIKSFPDEEIKRVLSKG